MTVPYEESRIQKNRLNIPTPCGAVEHPGVAAAAIGKVAPHAVLDCYDRHNPSSALKGQ
ncbi:MAG: hypothetical protein AB7K24_25505 [Gemmataceae bacterium]